MLVWGANYMAKAKRGLTPKEHQVKVPEMLWNRIDEIAKEIGYDHGGHTGIIHEMLSAAVARWMHSPYVCRAAQHVVLVTEQGDVFYRVVQELNLNNSDRQKLPCMIEMKPEKREYYAKEYGKLVAPGISRGDWVRSRWLINYFSIWKGLSNFAGEPLNCGVDRDRAGSKMVDLPLLNLEGRRLTREIVIGLRDYVQWKEAEGPKSDRVEFSIDIPTRDLKALVVVDEGLYKHLSTEEIPRLDLEFRNREWARFVGTEAIDDVNRVREQLRGHSSSLDTEGLERVRGEVEGLLSRLRELAKNQVDGLPVVTESARVIIESLTVPERFLFFEIDWPSPHFGMHVCVHWEKPARG
jgi:hypothetical protein